MERLRARPPAGNRGPLPDLGSYHTIGVLGEGGMGIVYLAEQREPIRRRVALKVLKHGDSGSSLARFESESQALALMDHPNIAQIYEAGSTANGRPYFVMEYVPGIPITDYCDRNLLGCHERLMLFQQVCQAVHHAHQKGIIHRDLKPSNVLVMLQDGKPVPKIIDFGVAKAVNRRLVERTLFTEFGMLIGTPEYMSPEQADLTGLDVDSTSDIYSLGVLLYELLVGALPFDSRTLRKAGYGEIQRMIREEEAPKLSTRLSSLGNGAQEVARRRRSDVRTLVRLLRGDLESITMKALEKDRTRRYASASEFASDIGRHMTNEPVAARPAEIGYRIRKFVRRHRGLVTAGSTVVLALLVGAIVSMVLYRQAVRERDKAEAESYSANLIAADLQLRAGHVETARSKLAKALPGLRGWEWHHLLARTDQSTATIYTLGLLGPEVHLRAPEMRFNESGTQLFVYGGDYLHSWDLASKRLVTAWSGPGRVLTVGPLGRTVLVGSQLDCFADPPAEGFVLRLYEVSTRKVLSVLRGMTGNPGSAAISADGTSVAVAMDNIDVFKRVPMTIIVWNARTGEITARLEDQPNEVPVLRISPNGRVLATSGRGISAVQLWDLSASRKSTTLRPIAPVISIAFSPDDRLLAAGGNDGTISILESATGRLQRSWKAQDTGIISALAFSPDGSQLASAQPEAIRLWDVSNGQLLRDLGGHAEVADTLVFHPTRPRLYASGAGVIKEWDLSAHREVIDDVRTPVMAIAVSPDSRWMASGSADGNLRTYDVESGSRLRSWSGHAANIRAVTISPDSQMVASGSDDNTIRIWRAADGQLLRTLTGHTGRIWSLAFDPNGGRLISASEDGTVRIWEWPSKASPAIIQTHAGWVAVSPDGHTVLTLRRNDKAIQLWDIGTTRPSGTLGTDTAELSPVMPRSFVLSKDGQVLIGPAESGSAIAIWDFQRRRLKQILPVLRGDNGMGSLAISPDGSRVAFCGYNSASLSVWDLQKGTLLVTLGGHSQNVNSLAWSPDGTRLFTASRDGTVRVWNSRGSYNHEAGLLLEKLSTSCLLAEECVKAVNAQATISPDLRRDAIQLAKLRGNAYPMALLDKAGKIGLSPSRSPLGYQQALHLASTAAQVLPWFAYAHVTLALLQYRTGDFEAALLSAQRAINLQRACAPVSHAIQAMAYYRLHDLARAREEVKLAHPVANQPQDDDELALEAEAQALIAVGVSRR
jgi:WD40 repeat protein